MTPVIAMSKKAIKKAKKAEKASQDATKVETKAEKKARKATAKAERKAKKAAERAAREKSSQTAGIDSIDAIKDQIADLKKTHKSLARETTKIIDRLTAFHDGVLSLHPSGENASVNDGYVYQIVILPRCGCSTQSVADPLLRVPQELQSSWGRRTSLRICRTSSFSIYSRSATDQT